MHRQKITRCISHIPTDAVRLVDVRYSVFVILGLRNQKDSYRTSRQMGEPHNLGVNLIVAINSISCNLKSALKIRSQIFQPRIVVQSFGKIVKRPVCVKNGGELPTAGVLTSSRWSSFSRGFGNRAMDE